MNNENEKNPVMNDLYMLIHPYVENPQQAIQVLIMEAVAKMGENIKVGRFAGLGIQD